MTRVQRNKKLRLKQNILIRFIKTIIYLIVGTIAIIYGIIKTVNKITIRLYELLPKVLRVGIVYALIILSILYITNPKVKVIAKEKVIKELIVFENKETIENNNNNATEEKTIDLQNDNANNIYHKAIDKGLTKEQAVLVVSISRHETGNWTSKAFNDKHNFGGIMCNQATEIKRYSSYDEGLEDFIRVLKTYYFDLGLNDIAAIGAKYCPVGAKNDPHNLNQYWVGGVTDFYNYYIELV